MTAGRHRTSWTAVAIVSLVMGALPPHPAGASPGPFAYITNFFNSNVSVIDTATNTVVATVPVAVNPIGVAVSPDGTRVYVTHEFSKTVSVIDSAINAVVATVPVAVNPIGVAVSPDGSRIYVANEVSGTISVINATTNTVIATVGVGTFPIGVAVAPDGARAYVANAGSTFISIIDTATNAMVATVPVCCGQGVAVSPDGSRVYVADGGGTVSVVDTTTNTVVATVGGGFPIGFPISGGVAVTPDGSRVYVTNGNSGTVSVISTAANAVLATVTVGLRPVAFGQFIQPPRFIILFTAFSTKVDIDLASSSFEVNSTFTPGAGGSISPMSQDVKLQVGSFSTTIPAGSFQQTPQGKFVFEGAVNGVALEADLTSLGGNSYSLETQGFGVRNLPTSNPVTVGLAIGNNMGRVTVNADFQ